MLNQTFTGIDIYSATCYNIRHIYGHLLWGMTYKWPVYPNQQHPCCYLLGWQIDCHLLQIRHIYGHLSEKQTYTQPIIIFFIFFYFWQGLTYRLPPLTKLDIYMGICCKNWHIHSQQQTSPFGIKLSHGLIYIVPLFTKSDL